MMLCGVLGVLLVTCTLLTGAELINHEFAQQRLNVTFIYSGPVGDWGYNFAFDRARNAIQVHYKYDVWCFYDVADPSNTSDVTAKITEATKQSDVVITTSSDFRAQTVVVAGRFPHKYFLMAGGNSSLPNVGIYQTVYNDAKFRTGILAALKTKTNKICFLSAFRLNFLLGGFNSFYLGAKTINPNITAYIAFIDTWNNVTAENYAVQKMLDVGCDVVNGQTNNIEWMKVADRNGTFSIGFNSDTRLYVGETVLASVMNDFEYIFIQYFDLLLSANKTFRSGVTFYNMQNQGVKITDFGQAVTRDEARRVLAYEIHEDKFFCGPLRSSYTCNFTNCLEADEMMVPNGTCITNWNITNFRPFLLEGTVNLGTIIAPSNEKPPEPKEVIYQRLGTETIVGIVLGVAMSVVLVSAFTIFRVRMQKKSVILALKQVEEGQKKNYKIIFNELKFIDKIGSGNFGMVFSGEYRGADVAIKRLKEQALQRQQIDEFTQEVNVMVGLRHPHIVLLMGACNDPPNLCIITEFMPQGSLYSIIHNEKVQFTELIIKTMVLDMLKGLQFIHSAGLLHRDLKSPNLLIDKRGNLKLADFGLTILQSAAAKTVHVSVPWTAPEIFAGHPYTAKADIYSVGIIMWEMISRLSPYEDMLPAAIPIAVMQGKRPEIPMSAVLMPGLIPLIQKCWSPHALDRPDIAELRRSVEILEIFADPLNRNGGGAHAHTRAGEDMRSGVSSEADFSFSVDSKVSAHNTSDSSSTMSIVLPKMAAPTGLVTFVYLDVPESGTLWEWDPYTMHKSLAILLQTVELLLFKHRGYLAKTDGDCFLLSFADAPDAAAFAVDIHLELLKQEWPPLLVAHSDAKEEIQGTATIYKGLRVRTAAHTGLAHATQGSQPGYITYSGIVVDLTVKLGRVAQSGQVLMTEIVRREMGNTSNRLINQTSIVDLQSRPCKIYQLTHHTLLAREFSPLATFDESAPVIEPKDLLSRPEKWILSKKDVRLGNRLGAGGSFGEAFLARLGNMEAVAKIFPVKNLKASVRLELRMEMACQVMLSHPNVGRLYGLFMEDEIGIVQEFVPRGSMGAILADKSIDLNWDRKLSFALGIASGMAYLHANGILHWDVKPSNFLVSRDWEIKVSDLGFARIKTQFQTTTQSGVVAWTAPEVFDGEAYTKKAEVYAFGIILWEIITRQQAWDGVHAVKIADMVMKGHRPVVSDIVTSNSIVTGMIKIAIQCWHPLREERPSFKKVVDSLQLLM